MTTRRLQQPSFRMLSGAFQAAEQQHAEAEGSMPPNAARQHS